ncbi:glycerol-3-phosphate dehydrogenase [Sphingobium nicotianae]|uniref:Glycerol-3-phosphate dehydrogenase n=1 Tax=Sphingobium nicotianae TaxID=2782607 RepID=A0A9X1ISZ1_9SPHN|nr:glycerol-3-phosphate dehydrogenase [Sphingobium nicotianae]MBT2188790.1 glycerol-3-phosphate dehydrogenase [Sphingobium nicotianae]
MKEFDILIVGGGINGAAIARDAAGRGASTLLVDKDDFAAHTSSASTKLIHGGLRYLENYEFRMVSKALRERDILQRSAPHLIRPLQFVLPYDGAMRPAWMMRAGLFLYDILGGSRSLPRSRACRLTADGFGQPLMNPSGRGFTYWDCWGDDSRLVIANLQDASGRGAQVMARTRISAIERGPTHWTAHVQNDEQSLDVSARVLVNATGAAATHFLGDIGISARGALRTIKGSHIVTRRLFEGEHAFLLQNPDGRIVFAIPYETDFTLIGTTDVEQLDPLDQVSASPEEIDYLCEAVNRWFRRPISPSDVVWSFAGIRPLYDDANGDPSDISRDYVLDFQTQKDGAPVLSVFGGKITTHRSLGEEALNIVRTSLPGLQGPWTKSAPMPGGDLGAGGLEGLTSRLSAKLPFLDTQTHVRLARSYGSLVWDIFGDARSRNEVGEQFGAGLTEVEVRYLIRREWARTADDIVWRRSKLGLHLSQKQTGRLDRYLKEAA